MMRFQWSFLALVGTQAAHSVEEYVGRLYDVFPPAHFVSGLISQNLQRGFLTFNIALVSLGLWCFVWPIRKALAVRRAARLAVGRNRASKRDRPSPLVVDSAPVYAWPRHSSVPPHPGTVHGSAAPDRARHTIGSRLTCA